MQGRSRDRAQAFTGPGDGVEHTAFGIATSVELYRGLSLSFGVEGALHARNLPAAPAYDLALSYER